MSKAKKTDEVIYCDNFYWTGCWNYAIELFEDTDADILWVLGGDVELRGEAADHVSAMKSAMPFGCWHPGVDGVSRPLVQHSQTGGKPWEVWHLEGIAMAVSRQAVHEFKRLPKDNKFGWGLDIWLNWRCWKVSMRNILDGRVKIFHPDLRGYSTNAAHSEMFTWFEKTVGGNYRDELHYWSDDFSYNKIGPMKDKFGATVVVTSYNQLSSLKLVMESFRVQSVKPIEVIVADDGSTDGTTEWLDALDTDAYPFPVAYITCSHNGYNLAGAYNEAARKATGERIIFTNADIIHNRYSVEKHMSHLKRIVNGMTTVIPLPLSRAVTVDDVREPLRLKDKADDKHLCNSLERGGNLSFPADIFRELGGFSKGYNGKYGSECLELVSRAQEGGHELAKEQESCGFHLAHPARGYKQQQLGHKKFREDRGIKL
jgi:GT2 family glycosyltransferase